MKRFTLFALIAVFASNILLAQAVKSDSTDSVIIKINNVRSGKGKILVMAHVPGRKDPVYAMADAREGDVTLVLKGINGDSAEISLFHDENGNFKMDVGQQGPVEGYVTKKWKFKEGVPEVKVTLYYPDVKL